MNSPAYFSIFALWLALSTVLLATDGDGYCRNDDTGTCNGSCGSSFVVNIPFGFTLEDACEVGGNPFAAYSGNVSREINDLEFWNTPGQDRLVWTRVAISRLVQNAASYFGSGHQWFHNWDARLSDAGYDGSLQLIEVQYPNGSTTLFKHSRQVKHNALVIS